jgi:transposase-like protein
MRAWFEQGWKCLDRHRWPNGFVCPRCESSVGWRLFDARWLRGTCTRKTNVTAGTIFNKTRTPLTVWFAAAWLLINSKIGISATHFRREMEVGSIQTAWVLLHRYRIDTVR